jgi:uncharacterized membrane protein YraQ (UPF0718 family)
MTPETINMIKETLGMFVFLATELTILFLLISYLVGVLQEYIPPEKIKNILSSKHGKGYIIAALLGAITPFCSCSTIPFLKGLLRAKAGFGPMMVFLFSSPLLNPIVIVLFVVTFGLKVAALYFIMAMSVSVIAGYFLERFGFEKYIIPLVDVNTSCATSCNQDKKETNSNSCCDQPKDESKSCCSSSTKPQTISKWRRIWDTAWADFKVALPYLLIGVSIGAIIHGFVPTEFITQYTSDDNPLAIPFAAVVGIPLYVRAATLIPLSIAFVAKGMGIGAVMAFIIGSAGASLPEVILLKSMFRSQLIIAFLSVVLGMAVFTGFIFSLLF